MPQGTVKSYDPETNTAVVLDDQLVEHTVSRDAFAASGLLELRLGQRVRFEVEETGGTTGEITNVNIVSL